MNEALEAWNPWWTERVVPPVLLGRPRQATPALQADLDAPEVLAITGIRRCGKSTLMLQLVDALLHRGVPPRDIWFANLEDPGLDGLGPKELLDAMPTAKRRYLFLDEVQERPGWERWVRVQYDQKTPVKFIVSGSSSELTRGDYARLLTGRNKTHHLSPLDFGEFLHFQGNNSPDSLLQDHYMLRGGFPEAVLRDPHEARGLLEHYFRDILQRDLVGRRNLDPERVQRLALYLARAFGGPHTKRRVANATHIAPETLRTYLEAMQDAFLLHIVPRFTDSPRPNRETEAPFKVYWADTGLRNCVVPNPHRDLGTQAENLVAIRLAKDARPFYWSDGRHEVDFLIPRPDGVIDAFQVCFANQVPERELAAFDALALALPRKRQGTFTLLTADRSDQRGDIKLVPLHEWLLVP